MGRIRLTLTVGAVWLAAYSAPGLVCPAGATPRFAVPPALQDAVDFWRNVFTVYSKHQVVIHDTERLDRVYSLLDFRHLVDSGLSDIEIERTRKAAVEAELERIRGLLHRLHRGEQPRTAEEARIRRLFDSDRSPERFLAAASADRVRSQTGIRERFLEGVAIGRRYFPTMEAIFRDAGVPIEITRLPLVESTFNVRAYSKVGAAGIWQFMPATARIFSLQIDDAVDERLDPIAATRAAARYLSDSYRRLGTWPLAIMSYNHGPGGIARAVRTLGTKDETTLIRRYQGPAFKFASSNFYPEFLAALEVERDFVDYFGPVRLSPAPSSQVVLVESPVGLASAAGCADTSAEGLAELNPSLLPAVRQGARRIPGGYALRVPAGSADDFRRCYAGLPVRDAVPQYASRKSRPAARAAAPAKNRHVVHRVGRGQTLTQIARRYGCSVDEIRRRNGLGSKDHIRTGQLLRIPAG